MLRGSFGIARPACVESEAVLLTHLKPRLDQLLLINQRPELCLEATPIRLSEVFLRQARGSAEREGESGGSGQWALVIESPRHAHLYRPQPGAQLMLGWKLRRALDVAIEVEFVLSLCCCCARRGAR